jgi:catechol 2,3-dioxygenase-like lactoylglutathione lyase family enzyme
MMELTFDHVHLRSPDPEATATWFETMLGAQVIRSMSQGAPRIDLKIGGQDIFIAPVGPDDKVNPAPVTPVQGLDHIGFFVRDFDSAVAALKAKGVVFTAEPYNPRPGLRICFIRGPQGISIELLERDAKYR